MVYYRQNGAFRHVLVSGAVNARQPNRSVPQVKLRLDYSGGRQATGHALWKTFRNRCSAYDGPSVPYAVATCRAPNGSYWAIQEWQLDLPPFGLAPWLVRQRQVSIRISHWSTALARIELYADWIYGGKHHEVFGRATYLGKPVHGFTVTRRGAPIDRYGRLMYLDTLGSVWGPGWKRARGFLPHGPTGVFCVGLYRNGKRPAGNGKRYRVTMVGPGVTPDVVATVAGLHDYRRNNPDDVAFEAQENKILDQLAAGGRWCHHH